MAYVNQQSCKFLDLFFEKLLHEFSTSEFLYLRYSTYFQENVLFSKINHDLCDSITEAKSLGGQEWSVVFGDFPFSKKSNSNWRNYAFDEISSSIRLISKNGIGVFLLPSYGWAFRTNDLNALLEERNSYVNSIVSLPSTFMHPVMGVRPILVVVGRYKLDDKYFVEFEELEPPTIQLNSVVRKIVSHWKKSLASIIDVQNDALAARPARVLFSLDSRDIQSDQVSYSVRRLPEEYGGELARGFFGTLKSFKGFSYWKISKSISKLSTDYAKYTMESLEHLSKEINFTKSKLMHFENSVYIPLVGKGKCVVDTDEIMMKHKNFCQVIVDSGKILHLYLLHFLNSEIGSNIRELKQLEGNSFIVPKLSRSQVLEIEIALPPIPIQQHIVDTANKLNSVSKTIQTLHSNLSINPISSKKDLAKLDQLVSATGDLSNTDEIKSLVRLDESRKLEFKESFSWNLNHTQLIQKKDKHIEKAVIKTVAAFMNSDGGILLVGVDDSGKIKGLNHEIDKFHRKNRDKFMLYLKDRLKVNLGAQNFLFLESELVEVDTLYVLKVSCSPSTKEVFVNKNEFYIRTTPATERLEGHSQIEYIRGRFPQYSEKS